MSREDIERFESLKVYNAVLVGRAVPPEEIWKLLPEHMQSLWDRVDSKIDLTELLARQPTYEEFERSIYPHRALGVP